ncbi:MAG TPA: hypothetical protein PLQ97_13605 [Myxococcota bacterium]|nr:hypothetical protein [Myxococcota bacterium]HQK52262.1 hypothetical protein [Myxococcota bacterium]
MSDYDRCPRCGRKAERSIFTNHFDVIKCLKCGAKYCYQCEGSDRGQKCPECGAHDRTTVGKVYQ